MLSRLDGLVTWLRLLMDPVLIVEQSLPLQGKVTLVELLLIINRLYRILVVIFVHGFHDNKAASIEFQLSLNDTGGTFSGVSSLLVSLLRLDSRLFTFFV